MVPETAQDFCFAAYLENCLAPAAKRLDNAQDRVGRLYGQITFVQACWWLNLSLACGYVSEGDAKRLLEGHPKLFSLDTVKELLEVDNASVQQDLIRRLRYGDPRTAFSEIIFSKVFPYETSSALKSHFQTAMLLGGNLDRQPGPRYFLSQTLFADEEWWEKTLSSPFDREGLGSQRAFLDSSKAPPSKLEGLVVGFLKVLEHMAAIDMLFRDVGNSKVQRDVANLESGVKTVLSARIDLSGKGFRNRFLQTSELAGIMLFDDAFMPNALDEGPDWKSEYPKRVIALVDRWQPAPVRVQVVQELDF